MEDSQIDLILQGLRDLHTKLNVTQIAAEHDKVNVKKSDLVKFESNKDQVLQSLKELFLTRIKENKEKRLRQNLKSVKAIREVPRRIWITNIMAYLTLDECLQLGQVCVFFNQIVKSPLFIKFKVIQTEKTKIDVSSSHFSVEGQKQQEIVAGQEYPVRRKTTSDKEREDKEAKIEILTNMKLFMQGQVAQAEEKLATNLKDLGILKEMLRIEKNSNQKKEATIKLREEDLKEARATFLEQQGEWLMKKNEMQATIDDQLQKIQNLQIEVKKLKIHKKVLKEEVTNLRSQVASLELKAHNKDTALNNLNEFFKRQTDGLNLDELSSRPDFG